MPPRSQMPRETFESQPDHPLFPVEDGEPNPQVDFIQITRKDRGSMVYGPCVRGDELLTTDQIFDRWGGGHYELWARSRSHVNPDLPNKITKRRWIMLAGRSKPLSQDPTAAELQAAEMMPPAASSSAAAGSSTSSPATAAGGAGEGLLVAVLQMQQQSSQQFMMMMIEMMKSGKTEAVENAKAQAESSKQFVQMMMTMSAQQQQSMVAMMTALMGSRGGGPEELEKYAALLKSLGFSSSPKGHKVDPPSSDSVGAIVENLADIVQGGVQLLQQTRGLPPMGPPNGEAATSPPAAPGSAASVIDSGAP